MSSCNNPNCPEHGTSPEAVATRQALKEIKTNGELMDMIRVLAANTNDAMIQYGIEHNFPIPASAERETIELLKGNNDQGPEITGLVRGFAVLLKNSEPFKVLAESLKEVREPHFVERMRDSREKEFTAKPIRNIEDLINFLMGGGR